MRGFFLREPSASSTSLYINGCTARGCVAGGGLGESDTEVVLVSVIERPYL